MALRDLTHRYLYGKPGRRDFTQADLPGNRVQLFRHVLGIRLGKMVWMNLLCLLIWLPAIAWTSLIVLNLGGLPLIALNESGLQMLPAQELQATVQRLVYTWLLILWPLVAIAGPFNAGVSDVFQRWARDESLFPLATFRAALKANWKQGLLFGIVDGLIPLLVYVSARFYWELSAQSGIFLIPVVALLILFLLWILAAPLAPQLIVGYELRFGGVLKNALLMTIVSLPRSIAIRVGTLAIPILLLLGVYFFQRGAIVLLLIGSLLYAAILFSFNKLIWASYANALGEKYLNTRIPGAPTNIGLRPDTEE